MGGKVSVGGRDYADVDPDTRGAANPLELLLLQGAEQLGLQVDLHFGDLVQEQRPAVRPFKRTPPLGWSRR